MGKSPAVKVSPLWLVRGAWLALPLLAGPVFADALDPRSRPVQLVASGGLWLVWALVLVATLLPRTVTLTAVRVVAPGVLAAVVVAVVDASSASALVRVAALVGALVVVGVSFAPSVGQAFVNGSSYGEELRVPLRVPAPLLLGPVEVAWLATAAGLMAGPLLLAARQWVVGLMVLALGLAAAWWGVRVLHTLAQRWVVFVPAGLVLHDPLTLVDPILLRRSTVRRLGPAPAATDGLDLTRGALGLALEADLVGDVSLTLVSGGRGAETETVDTAAVLFTPTRPGVLLAAARSRNIG
jgi:hypothetical protein